MLLLSTCSVTVLAGELLREAEKLVAQRIHPMIIAEGEWNILPASGPSPCPTLRTQRRARSSAQCMCSSILRLFVVAARPLICVLR